MSGSEKINELWAEEVEVPKRDEVIKSTWFKSRLLQECGVPRSVVFQEGLVGGGERRRRNACGRLPAGAGGKRQW
jgi:hypothetical protein